MISTKPNQILSFWILLLKISWGRKWTFVNSHVGANVVEAGTWLLPGRT
jgi:hypothetical protein